MRDAARRGMRDEGRRTIDERRGMRDEDDEDEEDDGGGSEKG